MSDGLNRVSMYDVEPHVAEVYDQQENYADDVQLIRELIGQLKHLRIFEAFCGTGRILIPLALDGHSVVGMDRAGMMLDRAKSKINKLNIQERTKLMRGDVLSDEWPKDFQLVILGGNCLYELATAEEQERCIAKATGSLTIGGYLYLDNNHMEGPLAESWRRLDIDDTAFPSGTCQDGTVIQTSRQRISFDVERRLVAYRRRTTVILADGRQQVEEYLMQCHPPSTPEMKAWLERHGFMVEKTFGDRLGNHYAESSERAIFWARKVR